MPLPQRVGTRGSAERRAPARDVLDPRWRLSAGAGAHMLSQGPVLAAATSSSSPRTTVSARSASSHTPISPARAACAGTAASRTWSPRSVGCTTRSKRVRRRPWQQRHPVRRVGRRDAGALARGLAGRVRTVPSHDRPERRAHCRQPRPGGRSRRGPRTRSAPTTCALRDTVGEAILSAQTALGAAAAHGVPAVDRRHDRAGAPIGALAAGAAAGIPMIIGTNTDEMRLLAAGDPHRSGLDDEALRRRLEGARRRRRRSGGGGDGRAARAAKEPAPATSGARSKPIASSGAVVAGRRRPCPARAAHAHVPLRLAFTRSTDGSVHCHVLEIPFVFGLHDAPHLADFTGAGPAADALSRQMMSAWTAFARTDDPRPRACVAAPRRRRGPRCLSEAVARRGGATRTRRAVVAEHVAVLTSRALGQVIRSRA